MAADLEPQILASLNLMFARAWQTGVLDFGALENGVKLEASGMGARSHSDVDPRINQVPLAWPV